MAVIKSTDNNLRKLGFADKYTIVIYDNGVTGYSERLQRVFQRLSDTPEFSQIKFLSIHSNENPVARQEVDMKHMPFLSIYSQGFLIDCGCVRSEKGICRFLKKLLSIEERKKRGQHGRSAVLA